MRPMSFLCHTDGVAVPPVPVKTAYWPFNDIEGFEDAEDPLSLEEQGYIDAIYKRTGGENTKAFFWRLAEKGEKEALLAIETILIG